MPDDGRLPICRHRASETLFIANTWTLNGVAVGNGIPTYQSLGGGANAFSFLAVSNRSYQLEYSSGLSPVSWIPSGTLAPAATHRLIRWTNAPPLGDGLYRLRIPQFP